MENAYRSRRYGTARRSSNGAAEIAKLYCHGDVESRIARVDRKCVVRLSWV